MLELAPGVTVGGMAGEMSSLRGASRNACTDPSAPPRQLDTPLKQSFQTDEGAGQMGLF